MKKQLSILALLLCFVSKAQNFKYGIYLGGNAYDIEIGGPLYASGGYSSLNIGVFGDYQLNNRFGVKANLFFNKTTEGDYGYISNGIGYSNLYGDVKYNAIQLQGLLKFDVRKSYDKGFYLLTGLRLNSINNVSMDKNKEFEDELFKKTNFGVLFGFGTSITKYVNFEILGDRNLGNPYKNSNDKVSNYGIYANLNINISEIIKKN